MSKQFSGNQWLHISIPLPEDATLRLLTIIGYGIAALGALAIAIIVVTTIVGEIAALVRGAQDRRARRFMDREIARGALQSYEPQKLAHSRNEHLETILADAVEGRRPVRRVPR